MWDVFTAGGLSACEAAAHLSAIGVMRGMSLDVGENIAFVRFAN